MTLSANLKALPLDRIYRLLSVIWVIYSAGLMFSTWGTTLLSYADVGRWVVAGLAALTGVGMIVRLLFPGRPEWTRWTLPVMGGVGVAAFVLAQFGIDYLGGFTSARLGYTLLLITPALIAYVHWVAERLVEAP